MNLLYLTHRLPYPPNKGDKISTFNILKYFSKNWNIYLGTFIDDPSDWQYVDIVKSYCVDTCIRPLHPRWRRWASLRGLVTGAPLSTTYYADRGLKRWVERSVEAVGFDGLLLYSGCTAQFTAGIHRPAAATLFDAEDVDSEKWRSFAATKRWPSRWLYAREARRLLDYERRMAARYDVTVFISEAEAALFKHLAPEVAERVTHRTQGVDATFFDPAVACPDPYPAASRALVFTGAMDYWPNVQAVTWFADAVLPRVRAAVPEAAFYIVGMRPSEAVLALGQRAGIVVTGAVDDVRPYVKHAYAACLPLRIARGIQNKALEAMAMARPIVATPEAMEGIPAVAGFAPAVAAEPAALADAAVALLRAPPRTEPAARAFVLEHCDWQANLRRLEQRLLPPEEGRDRAAPEAHSTTPPASVAVGAGASTCTPSRRSG